MEKRALLAVSLSMMVFVVFQYFFAPPPTPLQPQIQTDPQSSLQKKSSVTPQEGVVASPAKETSAIETVAVENESMQEAPLQKIRVFTGLIEVLLTNKGAGITAIYLDKYAGQTSEKLNLLLEEGTQYNPLTVRYGDDDLTRRANKLGYRVTSELPEEITLSDSKKSVKIRFEYKDKTNVVFVKEYSFTYNDYRIGFGVSVTDNEGLYAGSNAKVAWGGGISLDGDDSRYGMLEPALFLNNELITDTPDDGEEIRFSGRPDWVAVQSKYFMNSLIPVSLVGGIGYMQDLGNGVSEVGIEFPPVPGKTELFQIYSGPKQAQVVQGYGYGLEHIINYGWFDFVGKPLFKVLKWLYKFTNNFGVAIILVTILIKIVFFPLTQKSFKSMKQMQKIQPKMKVLQERFKNDKTKLNQEMMKLYSENKVNPLGGCLPTVVQIPVFISLYRVILNSIELRDAPFMLWITDLSIKDPYYVTPLLMGASMFLQQRMTPTTVSDPTQAKIMMFLPVIFTVMFLNFPAGLVLYWLVNNLLTVMQQYFINRPETKKTT